MKLLYASIVALLFVSCSTSQSSMSNTGMAATTSTNGFSPTNPSLSLADYLKRVPGVQVSRNGTGDVQVLVRGNSTLGEQREPLFVINKINVGFGYEHAAPLVAV